MKVSSFWASALLLLGSALPGQAARYGKNFPKPPGVKAYEHPDTEHGYTSGTFPQLLNHSDPSAGTFSQRFWFTERYWKGPGSPVILFNPGEEDASHFLGYLTPNSIPGLYAKTFGGLVIILEHRYWGESIPFDELTAETLQHLNLLESMEDMSYFATKVTIDLGGDLGTVDTADKAPWVLVGGSYSGALSAWTQQKQPGVFWAHHASSAVVETITDFYTYFAPTAEALPANCSADVRAVVQYVDHVLSTGTAAEKHALKSYFGLGMLSHDDDFAVELSLPMRQWQEQERTVYAFCDELEAVGEDPGPLNVTGTGPIAVSSQPGGLGLTTALARYAAMVKKAIAPSCRQDDGDSCSTYAKEEEDDLNDPDSVNDMRQWRWICCHNPFGWWQVGPPNVSYTAGRAEGIVSAYADVNYFVRQCPLMFPETNGFVPGIVAGWTPEHLNLYTGGWDAPFKRVLFVNGELDPWRSSTVSSDFRPGGRRPSTKDMPIFVVPAGNHVPEMLLQHYDGMPELYSDILAVMKGWLDEWTPPS